MIEVNWHPSRRELRQFAGIWFPAFFVVVGSILLWREVLARETVFAVWAGIAVISVYGAIFPGSIKYLFIGWICAAFPIGWVMSHVLIGVVYFLVLTPVGLMMRLVGYDPMERQFNRDAESYWILREKVEDSSRYFRQF